MKSIASPVFSLATVHREFYTKDTKVEKVYSFN